MTSPLLAQNFMIVLIMTIVVIAPTHAATAPAPACYDKEPKCDQHFLNKDLKRTTDPKDTDIRCMPYAAQTSEFLKDDSTALLPAYKRLIQCAEVQDFDSKTRMFITRTMLGVDLLGEPGQVPVPCGRYYKGDECTKKDL